MKLHLHLKILFHAPHNSVIPVHKGNASAERVNDTGIRRKMSLSHHQCLSCLRTKQSTFLLFNSNVVYLMMGKQLRHS